MRRALLVATLISGFFVGTAAPAGAAPPVREKQSGTFSFLESNSSECLPDEGGQTCTDIFLYASTDTSGTGFMSLDVHTYSVSEEGEFTPVSSESGFAEGGVDLTVTEAGDATLAPTPITLQAFTCTPEDCEEGDSREVVVSASDTAAGPTFKSRDHGSFRDGTCTYRYRSTTTGAEVEGTITIDDDTYAESGRAGVGQYRVTQRCK